MAGKNSVFTNNSSPSCDDNWLNMATTEIKNAAENTGQTASDSDLEQLSKAMSNAAAASTFYTDSGTTNVYVLTPTSPFKAPTAYFDGMEVRFRAGNASTAASTVNVASLGVKNIKLQDGTTDISTEINTNKDTVLRFDASNDVFQYIDTSIEKASASDVTTGTNDTKFITPLRQGWVKIASATASASATIDFTDLNSTYAAYKVMFTEIVPATDNADLYLRTSTDNGVSYDSGASDYGWVRDLIDFTSPSSNVTGNNSDTAIHLFDNAGNTAGEFVSGELTLLNPSATTSTVVLFDVFAINSSASEIRWNGQGYRGSAADVDAIRFVMSTGNITSGQFTLYGLKA